MNQQLKPLKIILLGDTCVDYYQYGTVDRISPEAPVPVFCPKYVHRMDGMAANVANNLRSLGAEVISHYSEPSEKTRIIDERSKQHLIRIDRDVIGKPISADIDCTDADVIVISDYNKGAITYELIDSLRQFNKPMFIDTKKSDLAKFSGCFLKINDKEFQARTSDADNLIVTYGGSHVTFNDRIYNVPTVPVFDVCGAGDTFLAALVIRYLRTANMDEAITFAIKAASITVQHVGVYAPTLEEIECLD
jgi:D-beta-D-heptose 7-phosphate kinase/D-beta-D-heptose 1-phosphate adenosyltransferase